MDKVIYYWQKYKVYTAFPEDNLSMLIESLKKYRYSIIPLQSIT